MHIDRSNRSWVEAALQKSARDPVIKALLEKLDAELDGSDGLWKLMAIDDALAEKRGAYGVAPLAPAKAHAARAAVEARAAGGAALVKELLATVEALTMNAKQEPAREQLVTALRRAKQKPIRLAARDADLERALGLPVAKEIPSLLEVAERFVKKHAAAKSKG